MPPGPGLAAVLAGIDLSRLGGLDCVTVMRAQHRQTAHEQARLMAAMVEVARCGIGPDDQLPRVEEPDEFAADEIRGALSWTRSAAGTQLSLAWDLIDRLPPVFAALDAGSIDVPKARVFSEWTCGLTDEQAHHICDQLLPEAPALTTGQLVERVKKMAIAIDPDWARRRYEEAVRDRKVVGYRNEDGTANLSGYRLPADRAAAACAHIDELARKAKRAGDGRSIDHIRADLYLAMLDGSVTGWSETDTIDRLLATTGPAGGGRGGETGDICSSEVGLEAPGDGESAGVGADGGPSTADRGCDPAGLDTTGPIPLEGDTAAESSCDGPDPSPPGPSGRSSRRAGVEIRVEVTTLLELDDHPAELAGWGPVHAELARRLVRDQTAAEWRYAITDDNGRLRYEGITGRRPAGYPARAESPTRGGIVELQVPLAVLDDLAAVPTRLGCWAGLIADLAGQADRQRQAEWQRQGEWQRQAGRRDDAQGRSPGRPLRRRTEIRDRTCVHPGCRTPASGTDGDHTREWAHGGATVDGNLGSLCRHDHRLRHEGGWRLHQPVPGYFGWISRLGVHYFVRPPLIIQPLPDAVPREPPPAYQFDDHGDQIDEAIWWEPSCPPAVPVPERSPPPDPSEPVPF
jgi:hypothetical protein